MKPNLTNNQVSDIQGGVVPGTKGIILGRLPEWTRASGNMELKNVSKINKYLHWQEVRIRRHFLRGEFERGICVWMKLLQESWGYQMVLFHRSNPKWYYEWSQEVARKKLAEVTNDLRKWDYEILIKRFYLEKSNGKLRPIGSPDLKSKMIGKAFADMLLWCGGSDIPYQHGFIPGKGVHTAIYSIIEKFEAGFRYVYEFDLKGWFNHVRPIWVKETVRRYSKTLSILFGHLIYKTHIKFDQLKQEMELQLVDIINRQIYIARCGMTQGMPYSPVAANIALSGVEKEPEGLTMYADDGVIQSKEKVLPEWLESIEIVGAKLALEKSGWVEASFGFLGVNLDLSNRTISYQDATFKWTEWNIMTQQAVKEWLKRVPNTYNSKTNTGWHWNINKHAYISTLEVNLRFTEKLLILITSIWKAKTYHGYRFFWGYGIVDVQSSSSRCVEQISRDRSLMHKGKLRKYTLWQKRELTLRIKRKGYTELIPYEYHPNGHTHVMNTKVILGVLPRKSSQ